MIKIRSWDFLIRLLSLKPTPLSHRPFLKIWQLLMHLRLLKWRSQHIDPFNFNLSIEAWRAWQTALFLSEALWGLAQYGVGQIGASYDPSMRLRRRQKINLITPTTITLDNLLPRVPTDVQLTWHVSSGRFEHISRQVGLSGRTISYFGSSIVPCACYRRYVKPLNNILSFFVETRQHKAFWNIHTCRLFFVFDRGRLL